MIELISKLLMVTGLYIHIYTITCPFPAAEYTLSKETQKRITQKRMAVTLKKNSYKAIYS